MHVSEAGCSLEFEDTLMGVLFLLCFLCRADYRKCRAFEDAEDALAIHKGILGNQYRWIFKCIKMFG